MSPRGQRTALQVMFLTGQSDPRSCALSGAQSDFLAALPVAEQARVQLNFPYNHHLAAHRPVPVTLASWRHVLLFVALRRRGFRGRHRQPVIEQLDEADHTLVLAGSIGLDILGRLDLPPQILGSITVFAFGPVSSKPPACDIYAVVGRRDHLARRWAGRADAIVDCGHMDYLDDADVAARCREVVARLVAGART